MDLSSLKLVVTNGCSFTYGTDLKDRLRSCWGRVLADGIGADFVNLAANGGSNHRLVRTTVEQLHRVAGEHGCAPAETLFVGMWTELPRSEIYDPDTLDTGAMAGSFVDRPWHRIGPWSLDRRYGPAVPYYRYLQHDEGDFLDFLLGYLLLESYLKLHGYRYTFVLVEGYEQLANSQESYRDYLDRVDDSHLVGRWSRCGEYSFIETIRKRRLPMSGRPAGAKRGDGHPLEEAHHRYALEVLLPFIKAID
jgi:hypothetical protein